MSILKGYKPNEQNKTKYVKWKSKRISQNLNIPKQKLYESLSRREMDAEQAQEC